MKNVHKAQLVSLMAVLLAGTVAAALVMQQAFPAVPATTLSAFCAQVTSSPGVIASGSSGAVTFDCGASTAAFSNSASNSATPVFSASSYVDLWIYPSSVSITAGCSSTSGIGGHQLSSGVSLTIQAGSFNYCADYANAPSSGLAAFSISWNQ